MVTMKGNYIHHTSGRSPKVGGNTLLHAVSIPSVILLIPFSDIRKGEQLLVRQLRPRFRGRHRRFHRRRRQRLPKCRCAHRCRHFRRSDLHCQCRRLRLLIWVGPCLPDQLFRQLWQVRLDWLYQLHCQLQGQERRFCRFCFDRRCQCLQDRWFR